MGRLQVGTYVIDVRICDIAPGGARIKVDLPLAEGARVILSHQRFGNLNGTVRWQADGSLGLAFDAEPETIIAAIGSAAGVLGLA